jgi:hypothetical protein
MLAAGLVLTAIDVRAGEPITKLDLSPLGEVFKLVGRTDADAKATQGVFRDPADGTAAQPVGVRIKTVDGHPPTYVLGVAVKLAIDESGDIRERHWSIEPPVIDLIASQQKKNLWFVSPSPGEYTVTITVVGKQSGIATDRIKINLVRQLNEAGEELGGGQASGGKSYDGQKYDGQKYDGNEKPADVVKRALAKVDRSARDAEQTHVQQVIAKSNTLVEARAYLLGSNSLGAEKTAAWQPLLSELEKLFDALRDQGRIPTTAHERGALEEVAKAMGE